MTQSSSPAPPGFEADTVLAGRISVRPQFLEALRLAQWLLPRSSLQIDAARPRPRVPARLRGGVLDASTSESSARVPEADVSRQHTAIQNQLQTALTAFGHPVRISDLF